MKILFLCNKSPWPPREGGPMAMNMFIEGLTSAGHQVKVLAVNSHKYNVSEVDIPAGYREKTGIELIGVDLRIKPIDAFFNLFTRDSYHVKRFISGNFRKRLVETLRVNEFDVVQLETLFMCPYIGTIREHSPAKIILRAHNIEHIIWRRIGREAKNPLKKWYLRHLARTLENYESEIVRKVDGIAAITPTDAAFFMKLVRTDVPVVDIPFGLEPGKYIRKDIEAEVPSLFSLGSMNWIPNQEGIRWFLREVWPDIQNMFPGVKYYLAGRGMPSWMTELKVPNVVVLGEIDNAEDFLASKSVMIVPLFAGSGIRVKIIEGMAAGNTIITTTVGAEGIACTPRRDILLADTSCEFFEAISMCLADPALCAKIGEQARVLAGQAYNSSLLVQKLTGFYQQLRG